MAAPANGGPACVSGVTSLAAGTSCDVRVSFAPAQRGPVEALLTARAAAGAASVRLAGIGLAPAALQATEDRIDFDGVVVGQGAQRVVSFENAGDEPLTLSGAGLEPADADGYAVLNSDCGSDRVLAAGESCSVIVEYRPSGRGVEGTAQLWASAGDQRQLVPLRGIGLDSGVLTITPQTPGEEDFGAVPLSGSVVRTFSVTNPGAQPSGALGVSVGEGFEIQAPPEPGECGHPETSIVNGQACGVRVRFAPSAREDYRRALTVSSALAGASSLAIAGRGVAPAAFEVDPEIDFGRVFTSASTRRTLTVRNEGDEPLAPPSIEVVGSANVMAPAFSYESACLTPLGNGEACEIVVSFAPVQPVPHWAELKLLSAPAAPRSVLLLAEALAPGALQVAPAAGGAADFGDVQIGITAVQTFTITNPGNVSSGRIAIRVDSNRFQVVDTECTALASGLEPGGAACTFTIQFTPDSSLDVIGNISVVSPSAGQAGLEIRGRGRAAAALVATGNRDLGRAIVGQEALTQPENQFTWTVNNQGDLATGVLSVANDNQAEFEVSNDTCNGATIAGAGTCEMTIRFRPADVGARGGNISVLDAASGRSATIVLTGVGERLAQLGQSCVNATCAAGMCTGGVCCDRACDGACQVCSATGVCVDQSGQEPCGNGDGRCFGVDRCLLPNGEACGQATDCGTGNCEPRLNGAGVGDRICCDRACSGLGLQCNAQGSCQQPTLEAGATCGAPSDPPCENGLECKTCLGGGSRCTSPDECCGGCQPGYTCLAGASCGCPVGQLDCGGGLCVQNRAGACCPSTPDCPAAQPNCDRQTICASSASMLRIARG